MRRPAGKLIAPPFIEVNGRHGNDQVAAEFVSVKGCEMDEMIRLEAKQEFFIRVADSVLKTKESDSKRQPITRREERNG